MSRLSKYFTLEELTASQYAIRHRIDNTPSASVLNVLRTTAVKLDAVRQLLGRPVYVSSGYRCPKLNAAIGGAKTSQHVKGEAVDFTCAKFGTPYAIVKAIKSSSIEFDQLICEGTWVHISFSSSPRREVLQADFSGGRVSYRQFV